MGRTLRGVRLRTTLLATIVVAVALAAGSVGLVFLARSSFENSVKEAGVARAQSLAELARNGLLPPLIATSGNVVAIQVIASDGELLAWSPGMEGPEIIGPFQRPGVREEILDEDLTDYIDERLGASYEGATAVVALGTTTPNGRATVLVGSPLDSEDSVDVLIGVLLWTIPALLVFVAWVTWWVTGRALHPVDDMRREAETITGTDLHRRLPVPEGRDEIHRLAETMNRMLDRLEESATAQRRFVADASHELKSPVAAIRTILEVARANPDVVDMQRCIDDLLYEDLRLEQLVGDLLILASSEEGAIARRRVETDLDDLVQEEAAAAGVRSDVTIDIAGVGAVRVLGDPDQLRRLLRNLLDNALRHARQRVWVEAARRDGMAELLVSDDGRGIPPEERDRVFERFVRLDDARARDDGGSGLGLSVVRAIAHAHGGEVRVVDSRHGGATFEVELPLGRI